MFDKELIKLLFAWGVVLEYVGLIVYFAFKLSAGGF